MVLDHWSNDAMVSMDRRGLSASEYLTLRIDKRGNILINQQPQGETRESKAGEQPNESSQRVPRAGGGVGG